MRRLTPGLLPIALWLAACEAQQGPAGEAATGQAESPAQATSGSDPSEAAVANSAPPAPDNPTAAAAPGAHSPWSASGYRLIGTEPFWGGTVTRQEIVYSTPENQQGERFAVTATLGANREVYTGTLDGEPFVLTLSRGPCSDGMSDNVHAFTALLLVGGETRRGCANPQ